MDVLAEQLRTFTEERDWGKFHSPKNLAMALSVEVAEILEHFQWLTEEESRSLAPERLAEVREEVGDVLIYLVCLSDRLGIDPLEAAQDKLQVNEGRYPADRVRGQARKYTAYGEHGMSARPQRDQDKVGGAEGAGSQG